MKKIEIIDENKEQMELLMYEEVLEKIGGFGLY